MADKKITELTQLTNLSGDDLLLVVDDPLGTPASKKITVKNLFSSVPSETVHNALTTFNANTSFSGTEMVVSSNVTFTGTTTFNNQFSFGDTLQLADTLITNGPLISNGGFTVNTGTDITLVGTSSIKGGGHTIISGMSGKLHSNNAIEFGSINDEMLYITPIANTVARTLISDRMQVANTVSLISTTALTASSNLANTNTWINSNLANTNTWINSNLANTNTQITSNALGINSNLANTNTWINSNLANTNTQITGLAGTIAADALVVNSNLANTNTWINSNLANTNTWINSNLANTNTQIGDAVALFQLNYDSSIANANAAFASHATEISLNAAGVANSYQIANTDLMFADVWGGLTSTNTSIRTAISGVWGGLTSTNTSIRTAISDEVADVWGGLTSTNTSIRTAISGVWGGLTSTNTSIRTAISDEVAALVDSAPGTLDTLNELAAALGDDANYSTTIVSSLANKMSVANTHAYAAARLGATSTVTLDGNVTGTNSFSANTVTITTSLNTSGNGLISQFLRSDSVGGFSWENPSINDISDAYYNTTSLSVGLGDTALANEDTTSIRENVGVGDGALSTNTTGKWNTAVGFQALRDNVVGVWNTAVGYRALNSSGLNSSVGGNNTAFGTYALTGVVAGTGNIGLGIFAGSSIVSGSDNTIIGNLSGTSTLADTVLIGTGTTERIKVDSNGMFVNGSTTAVVPNMLAVNNSVQSSAPSNNNSEGYPRGTCILTADDVYFVVGISLIKKIALSTF